MPPDEYKGQAVSQANEKKKNTQQHTHKTRRKLQFGITIHMRYFFGSPPMNPKAVEQLERSRKDNLLQDQAQIVDLVYKETDMRTCLGWTAYLCVNSA